MNDHQQHVDDDAALYALGMLEDADRARIDAHVRRCAACAARLGEAEAGVAALAEAEAASGARRAAPRFAAWGALAAAFVLAVTSAVLGAQNAALRADVASDGAVLGTLVRSHFLHAQFVAPSGAPIAAKVIYERGGAWYEILALGAGPGWQVTAIGRDGAPLAVRAPFAARGETAVAFVRDAGPLRELRLSDPAGRLVGVVRPVSEDDAVRR